MLDVAEVEVVVLRLAGLYEAGENYCQPQRLKNYVEHPKSEEELGRRLHPLRVVDEVLEGVDGGGAAAGEAPGLVGLEVLVEGYLGSFLEVEAEVVECGEGSEGGYDAILLKGLEESVVGRDLDCGLGEADAPGLEAALARVPEYLGDI